MNFKVGSKVFHNHNILPLDVSTILFPPGDICEMLTMLGEAEVLLLPLGKFVNMDNGLGSRIPTTVT